MKRDFDPDYRDRATTAMTNALFTEFMSEADGQRVLVLRAGEIADACLTMMAWMLATSHETSTPTKLRHLADEMRDKLIRRTRAAQEHGTPAYMSVVHLDEVQ